MTLRALGALCAASAAAFALTVPSDHPVSASVPSPDATGRASSAAAPSYAVPAGALYVSPSGRDSNRGTKSAPLATLTRAVAIAASGRTIVLRAGVYHETVDVPVRKRLTIESYPGEFAWLDGTQAVAGWTRSGRTWVHAGWNHHFVHTAGYSASSASGGQWLDPHYPMAAHPDQVWVGSSWLQQVKSASQVTTGTFYYDEAGNRLVIGSDPASKTVVASVRSVALTIRSPRSVVRWLGVRRYATSLPDTGAVRLWGNREVLQHVVVSEIATQGVSVSADDATIDHVSTQYCGLVGLHANESYNLRMSTLSVHNNNREHFSVNSPVQGGIKITKSRNVTLTGSAVHDNPGENGVWFDQSSYNVRVTRNQIVRNGRIGLYTELSSVVLVADNDLVGNGLDQLRIVDTNQVRVWNNTIGGGVARAIGMTQDSRRASNTRLPGHDARRPMPDPTVTWVLGRITFNNNIVGAGPLYHVYVMDQSKQRSAGQMDISLSGNLFSPQPAHYADVAWGHANGDYTRYYTAAQLNASTAGRTNHDNARPASAQQLQTSPAARATSGAVPLPSDVAAAIGQRAGTRHFGSF